jgi:hypothetical protein
MFWDTSDKEIVLVHIFIPERTLWERMKFALKYVLGGAPPFAVTALDRDEVTGVNAILEEWLDDEFQEAEIEKD